MHPDAAAYIARQAPGDQAICQALADAIEAGLSEAESRFWHGHPVWFLDSNPIVGFSRQKPGIRLMFWSGDAFDEPRLDVLGKRFMDASRFYGDLAEVDPEELQRWLAKARDIQFDYANLQKRQGRLERLR